MGDFELYVLEKSTVQYAHNVVLTFIRCRPNVMDVETTLCAYWELIKIVYQFCMAILKMCCLEADPKGGS